MNKVIIIVAFFATVFVQRSFGQNDTQRTSISTLLPQYLAIKNALVSGNGNAASAQAENFLKTLNTIDYKVISEGNVNALLKDVTLISTTNDLKKQREYFSSFSANMIALAKSLKLSDKPVYQAYCPMKKAGWLSSEKEIKNPYFGTSMLTCGSLVETIN